MQIQSESQDLLTTIAVHDFELAMLKVATNGKTLLSHGDPRLLRPIAVRLIDIAHQASALRVFRTAFAEKGLQRIGVHQPFTLRRNHVLWRLKMSASMQP